MPTRWAAVESFASYVIPIFRRARHREFEPIGTGFFVRYLTGPIYLVTAAHVMDWALAGEELAFHISPKKLKVVIGKAEMSPLRPSQSRDADLLDFAVLRLEGEDLPPYPAINVDVMPWRLLGPGPTPRGSAVYVGLGYPLTKTSTNPNTRTTKSSLVGWVGTSYPSAKYRELVLPETRHIVVTFDAKKCRDMEGHRNTPPNPTGMSGGPLLAFVDGKDATGATFSAAFVAGLLVEKRPEEKCMLATDISVVLNAIMRLEMRIALESMGPT